MLKKNSYLQAVLFAICILFWLGFFKGVNAQSVYLEWVDDPLESMVVNWIDDSGGGSSIDFRPEGSGGWSSASGDSRAIPGSSQRVYTVELTNLSSGQGYEFRIDGDSEIYKFRTAPEDLDEPIRFIVGGDILDNDNDRNDFDNAKSDFAKVSKAAATHNPYFAVLAGDLAHADGKEEFVNQWFDFFELWHENMVTDDGYLIPLAATPGNHEVPNGFGDDPEDAVYYYTFFNYPQNQWNSKISYGTLDFNNYLSVVTLDTDHTHRIPGDQTTWLNNTLSNRQNFRHVVPAYHVAGWPAFSSRTLVGVQENLVRNNWHKVFRNNNIRLVFEHHDHVYKRTRTIGDCDDEISHEFDCEYGDNASNGVIYMGGGAWGSENSRDSENRWYLDEIVEEVHNFVVVEISNNYRTATAIGEDGQEIDSFTDYVFLDPPEVLSPENITDESLTLRWEEVEGVGIYRLDVARDEDFNSFLSGYQNRNVGKNTSVEVDNLDPTEIYYFRVRAQNNLTTSEYSDVLPFQLVQIDPDLSSLTVSEDMSIADDEEKRIITAQVIDEEGELVESVTVNLFAEEGNLKVQQNNISTNQEGIATFEVFNDRAEIVTYGARVGAEELTDKVQVTYIPRPPVALAATNVGARELTANWEMVEDTDYYLLDVATDEEFSNTVSGYQGLDVGNITSQEVTDVNPGTEYFYRVRAVTGDLIGVNSEVISTITFPDTPTAVDASDLSVISFYANWEAAEGAENYRLEVARDSNFEDILEGYDNIDVGNGLTYNVEGLLPGREYYYRVQAEAEPRLSASSNTISTSTLEIDTESSEILPEQLRVLANGTQTNKIEVMIVGEDGNTQEGVPVQVFAENGNSEIEDIQSNTDENGIAVFEVTNTTAEKVTYRVEVADITIGSVELEFLTNEGVLSLGNNFPNPFRLNSAIPLAIPKNMHVELRVFNSLGVPVRTLLNEEVETGYYEVPFKGADLAAGVYFYRLITEEGAKTGKMVLVK